MNDARYAFRQMRRAPGFSLAVVLTLAVGIGGTAAMFTVVDGVLLAPIPYTDDQSRVVYLREGNERGRASVALANFFDWHKRARGVSAMGLFRGHDVTLTGGAEALPIDGALVTSGVFFALGVSPILGRGMAPDEDQPGATPVAVLREDLWRQAFDGDPNVVGRTVRLDGVTHTIVGVMPERYRFPRDTTQIWVALGPTLAENPKWVNREDHLGFYGVARLAPGITIDAARRELDDIARQLAAEHPDTNKDAGILVASIYEEEVGGSRTMLLALFGAVGLLLLVACANVVALHLARGLKRGRELSIRAALGAGRRRLVLQLLTESVLLAVLGGAAAYLVALWGVDALVALAPDSLPRRLDVSLDGRVMLFTAAVSLAAGVLVGWLPAWQATRTDVFQSLRGAGGAAPRQRAQGGLVLAQMAMALMLTLGAVLMMKSLGRLTALAPGLDVEGVLAVRLRFPPAAYPGNPELGQVARELGSRLESVPGVTAVGAAWPGPMYGAWQMGVSTAPLEPGTSIPLTDFYPINPGFFASLRIPVLSGRTFTAADDDKAPPVAIVSVSMARRLFGDENPLGKTLKLGGPSNLVGGAFAATQAQTIIGVVGEVRTRGFLRESPGQLYVPLAQRPQRSLVYYVKSGQPVAPAVRAEVAKLDPALALADVRPMADIAGRTLAAQRFATVLFGVFAGVAVLLCAIGVYGLVAFSVAQRTREIGIRVALGASPRSVVRLVVARVAVVVGAGVVAGLVGALALTRAIAALLLGMSPLDVALVAVAGIACVSPVRRALGVDPMTALRD